MSLAVKLILLLALILVNAFFAMSEMAIVTLNDNKIKSMADDGDKKAKKIVKLTSDSSRFLSTIQIGVTLAGFLTSAAASQNFAAMLSDALCGRFGIISASAVTFIYGLSVVLITLITSYFSLVFGELVPKKIAMQKSEQIAFKVVGILLALRRLLYLPVSLLTVSTNAVVRIFGMNPNAEDENVTEEEIRMMVDVGEENGVIEQSQREMINNIFEFDDIDVGDVMQHRTEISAVEVHSHLDDVIKLAIDDGFSRIPVYDDDLDNIVGVIYVKDLLPYVGKAVPKNVTPKSVMREPYHVPESKRCGELFKEMTDKHIQMAVVIDEYGGTAGLVTLEDLIESILGNIQDEYDEEDEDITKVDDSTYSIDGTCDIEQVEEMLSVTLPEGDYDTIGGLILSVLGRLPDENETPSIECAGFRFTVEKVDDRHIELVRAERLVLPPDGNDDE